MASSSYESTPETTNTNRVSRAFLGPCTDGLRDILRHYVPPPTFPHVIKVNKKNIPRLNADQRNLILPQHGSYTGSYDDMDISLLYILLRNICGIPPHSNGWNNEPDPIDRSLSANIERIRLIRNKCYGHSVGASMSNTDFLSTWSDIRCVMVDVDAFLNNGNKYQTAVDFLSSESMDPELDQHYENEMRNQVEEDRTTRKMVSSLKRKLEEEQKTLHGKVAKLTESPIPLNVREICDKDIQKWREEDKLYYEFHSFKSMMEKVRNQPCLTFVGVPGSGKSATAHHIALKLQEEGYELVPVDEIRDIKQYCDTKNPQVFIIDDVVGVFGLQKTKLYSLTDYEQKITNPFMVKSRTLMTCREAVFNETLPYNSFFTKEENVIRLHSSDHELDDTDKKQILQRYGLNEDLMSPALLKSTSRMFPLLCKLFLKETKFKAYGYIFFLNPVHCIIDELDNVQRHNKLNYATLVLCMLNENMLSKDTLKDTKNELFMKMKNDTLENCELESQTNAFQFVNALSAMEETYTKQSGAQYTFIHDSMFEICAYHYGKQFPDQMLLYMSSSYIANYVKPQTGEPGSAHKMKEKQSDSQCATKKGDKSSNDSDRKKESDDKISEIEKSFDLCIRLREDQYPLLAERLYRDIQNMELYDVFRNPVLKHPQVCQAFIGVLETKSYPELKSLFLSNCGSVDKIVNKREFVEIEEKESIEREELEKKIRQIVLVDRRFIQDEPLYRDTYNVRVISWVICYGHYHIIEYIMQQTEQHNETSELFEITRNYPHQSKSGISTCNEQESEHSRVVEQCRLLVLSCFSGDVQTVRILLPVCQKAINGIGQLRRGITISWCCHIPLTIACEGGHVDIVKELVKVGVNVNPQGEFNSPLMAACRRGYVGVVEELVKAKADVNIHDQFGNTPLIAACLGGHVSVVEELVKAGVDVNLHDKFGNTPLIAACREGHMNVMNELVKAGVNVSLRGGWGITPLIAACEGGHVSVIDKLMKMGVDVNLQAYDGNTPLIAACKGGHVSVMEELMKAGADVNLQDEDGNTPLIPACKGGHVSVVTDLLKAGNDVNLQNDKGNTPMIVACKGGHVSVVEELMNAGADVNLQGKWAKTPLIAACKGGHVSVVNDLVKAGADVNLHDTTPRRNTPLIAACKGGHVSVVNDLVKAGADVNLQGSWGVTPLITACKGGHVSVVNDLVKAGADVNLQGSWGDTPLITACKGGHVSVVNDLVKAGAYVNLQDTTPRKNTPLIAACEGGHVRVVIILVKAGADVNLQSKNYNTPLIAACEGGHESMVKELVKAGAKVNLEDNSMMGNTPLIAACIRGHMSVIEELVKEGVDVNLKNRCHDTPLIAACKAGHVSVVKGLMKAGAYVNLQDRQGNTPMIVACTGGHESVVEALTKAGADVNLQDNDGNTPLIVACKGRYVSTVEALVKAGAVVNLQGQYGNTPLIAACTGGHVSVVEALTNAGADVNLQDNNRNTPLIAACGLGHVRVVKVLLKAGADVNLQDKLGNTPLIKACKWGYASVVEELVTARADVNLQDKKGNTPLFLAAKDSILSTVREGSLSIVKYLVEHGADLVTQVVDMNVSVVYRALILNKPDILKYIIQEQNKINPGKFTGNVHLFNSLVNIMHAGVKTDSKDDVVVTDRSEWCMDTEGDLWREIRWGDCDVLRRLLCVGLDVNQFIQLYDEYNGKSDVRPLLYTLIDEQYVKHRTEKVSILLGAGADVNVRVRDRWYNINHTVPIFMDQMRISTYNVSSVMLKYNSLLDREGVSVLERTWRRVCKYKYLYSKRDMCEITKHVRRHSV